ncbi:MAG: WG repeat-containing protein [Prevotella sp.]|nr:WG repeat-containing protein [Prevotella sp.]MDY2749756.1 WG repeat-containing protein [Prevotella sp.]
MLTASLFMAAMAFTACSSDDDDNGGKAKLWPARSTSDNLWGYINEKGEMVITPKFTKANFFVNGLASVEVGNSKWFFIDTNGNIKSGNATFDEAKTFYNGYARVKKDGLYGLVDTNINYVIPPMFYHLDNVVANGLLMCKLSSSGKYCYVNTKGEKVIDYQFDDAFPFYDGVAAAVKIGNAWGLINSSGNIIVAPKYAELRYAGSNRYLFASEISSSTTGSYSCLYGLMDASGTEVVPAMYLGIDGDEYDTSGRFAAKNANGKWGFIDGNGNTIVDFAYNRVGEFLNGYGSVYAENGVGQIINTSGQPVLTLEKGEVSEGYHNGLIRIYKKQDDKGHGQTTYKYRNLEGKTVYMWVESY